MSAINPFKATPNPEIPSILSTPIPLTPVEYFMVSLAAKVTAVFCFHPFVTIKNEMQSRATLSPANAPAAKIPNLYRGVAVNLLNAPIFATMGCINGTVKNYLSDGGKEELTQTQKLCSSIFASVLGCFPWTMLDLLVLQTQLQNKHIKPHKTDWWGFVKKVVRLDWEGFQALMKKDRESRLQVKSQKKPPLAIFKEMVALRGIRGPFRGLLLTMGREIPFGTGLLYLGPEADKHVRKHLTAKYKPFSALFSGIVVGSLLSIVTHPIDMCKTTTQIDWTANRYPTFKHVGRDIHNKGGIKAFYKATLPRLMVICIASTVVINCTRVFTQQIQENKKK